MKLIILALLGVVTLAVAGCEGTHSGTASGSGSGTVSGSATGH